LGYPPCRASRSMRSAAGSKRAHKTIDGKKEMSLMLRTLTEKALTHVVAWFAWFAWVAKCGIKNW
jgi:hypothetical protein